MIILITRAVMIYFMTQSLLIHLVLQEIRKTFSVLKDYDKLILGALEVLSPNGTLLLCTNNSTFSLKAFKK